MATSEHGPSTGGPHDFSERADPRDKIATRLELRDVAALGDDIVRKLGGGGGDS